MEKITVIPTKVGIHCAKKQTSHFLFHGSRPSSGLRMGALAFLIFLVFGITAPAQACDCVVDDAAKAAQSVMADPSISVVDVYVRAINTRTHMSVLDIKTIHSGGLAAPYVRAKSGGTSCDIQLQPKTNMTVLIKNEPDGTYSLVGDCAHSAVLKHLGKAQ